MSRLQFFYLFLLLTINITYGGWNSAENKYALLGMGAKATALNNAFCAVADDYSATFWNPAALYFINSINVGGMYHKMPLNRTMNYAAFIFPISLKNTIGISWARFAVTDIEARRENTSSPDFLFENNETMIWFTYSRYVVKTLSVGLNLKYYQHNLHTTTANGGGFDIGMQLRIVDGLKIGFLSQDVGSFIKWDTNKLEDIRRCDRIGLSLNFIKNLLIACDVINFDKNVKWCVGTELRLGGILKLRSGFQNDAWAFGTGVSLPIFMNNFVLLNYSIKTEWFTNDISHLMDFNLQMF